MQTPNSSRCCRETNNEDEHLLGAISIPLKELDRESVVQLDRARPVIVYCYDSR